MLLLDTHGLTIFFSLDPIKNKGVLSYLTLIKHEGGHVKSFTYFYMIKSHFQSVKSCHQLYQFGGTWPYCNQPEKHTGLEYVRYIKV